MRRLDQPVVTLSRAASAVVHTAARTLVCCALLLLGHATAWGESFELFNGGRVHGTLQNPDESPRTSFDIELPGLGTISLTPVQVKRVAEKSEAEVWYETWLPKMPHDVRGNLIMAEQCKTRGLESQWIYHLEKVLELEPDHAQARAALGYSKMDGRWVKTDVWHRERGFVRYKGRWALPQEVALDEIAAQQEEAEKTGARQIRMWRSWFVKRREKAAEGIGNIRQIQDPAAVPTLSDLLSEKDEPVELRAAYIAVLGRIATPASTAALARCAIVDGDANLRERSAELLAARNDKLAVRLFINSLKDENNLVINRAAAALARMKDPSATQPLIEALITKHKFQIGGGGGQLSPTFTSDPSQGGLGGLNMGGKPKIVIREVKNQTVRDALLSLNAGINFGFDRDAWKRWLAETRMPQQINLRRDS